MTLLLFPATEDRSGGWLRLAGGGVAARGVGLGSVPTPDPGERVVLAAPGEAVALHWIELPPLAPNQARAAARLAAAAVIAQPLDALHVAVGEGDALRPMAVVEAGALAGWLAQAQAQALDPDAVVPEPFLLAAPDAGERHWTRDGGVVVRGAAAGHVADPALAAMLAEGPVETLDADAVEAGLADALATAPLDLRQGAFARRRRWGFDLALAKRLATIAALILIALMATELVRILRYDLAAGRAEDRIVTAAQAALPRATRIADPVAQLDTRLAELRGGGLGFSTMAGRLFGAIRDTAGVELSALAFDAGGRLTATVTAPGPAEVDALVARLERTGLSASAGAPRSDAGRQLVDLTVTAS